MSPDQSARPAVHVGRRLGPRGGDGVNYSPDWLVLPELLPKLRLSTLFVERTAAHVAGKNTNGCPTDTVVPIMSPLL